MGRFDLRESYGAKLAGLLVITTLLVGSIGVGIYYTVDTELTENTEAQLESSATSDATQVDNWLRLMNQQFVAVTQTDAVRTGDRLGAYNQLNRVTTQTEILGMALVNRSTETTTVETGSVDLSDEQNRLQPAIAEQLGRMETTGQQTSYSEPFRLDTGRPVVLAVTETQSRDGRALVSVVDLPKLSFELFGSGTREETVTVVNATGTVVLSSNQSALLAEAPVAGTGLSSERGVTTRSGSQELAIGYAATEASGWTMTTQLPTTEAYGLRDTVSKQILLLLGVLVAGLGGIGLTIGRNTIHSVRDLADRATTLQEGDLETAIESDRRDEFGDVYRALDAMRRSLREEISEAETAREKAETERQKAETARQEAIDLNHQLEATAAEFGATMDACAKGDLSQRLPTDTGTDAMDDIARAFNEMVGEWAATIQEVRAFGHAVESETESVTASVAEAQATSEALAGGMATIADESTGQAADIRTVREETEQLSATVEEASASAAQVASSTDEVLASGRRGREAAQAAKDELDAIEARTDAAAQQVDQLAALVDDVEAVTDLIAGIADQTNMLALNARIEAASAADSEGFGAVAQEVTELVEETQDATADIDSTIQELKSQTDTTAAEMADARMKVDDGAETIQEALTAFDAIVGDIAETADGISEIDRAITAQADSTQAVMSQLVTVSEVSTETATAADEAATDAQRQAERMATVSGRVDSLSAEARQLGSLLATFETGEQRVAPEAVGEPTTIEVDGSSWTAARENSDEFAADGGSMDGDDS